MGKAGSGSAKGAEFERHVCKLLSRWVTNGEKSDVFWRTSMSGGRATVARSKGEHIRQAGDITAVAPEGHALTDKLYFELKFYKNLELQNFFIQHKGTLAKFWMKTVEEAESYSKTPVLIVRQDRVPTLLLSTSGQNEYELDEFIAKCCQIKLIRARVAEARFPRSICSVYRLDDVLALPYRRRPIKRIRT